MSTFQLILVAFLIFLIALAIVVHLPPRRAENENDSTANPYYSSAADRDDESHWLGGIIYNNPDDPNLFVSKRYGLGWTLNFGHPQGKVLLIGLLLLIAVLVFAGPVLLPGSWGPNGYHPSGGGVLR